MEKDLHNLFEQIRDCKNPKILKSVNEQLNNFLPEIQKLLELYGDYPQVIKDIVHYPIEDYYCDKYYQFAYDFEFMNNNYITIMFRYQYKNNKIIGKWLNIECNGTYCNPNEHIKDILYKLTKYGLDDYSYCQCDLLNFINNYIKNNLPENKYHNIDLYSEIVSDYFDLK